MFQPERRASVGHPQRTVRESEQPGFRTHEDPPVTLEVSTGLSNTRSKAISPHGRGIAGQLPAAVATYLYRPSSGDGRCYGSQSIRTGSPRMAQPVAIRTRHRGTSRWRADRRRTKCLLCPYGNLKTAFK